MALEIQRADSKMGNNRGGKVIKRYDLRLEAKNVGSDITWKDLKDWARQAGDVTFTNVFERDGECIGVIEYEVRCFLLMSMRSLLPFFLLSSFI